MNVKQILPVAVMAIATLTGCEGKKEMNAGIRPENMDLTAQKGADFAPLFVQMYKFFY